MCNETSEGKKFGPQNIKLDSAVEYHIIPLCSSRLLVVVHVVVAQRRHGVPKVVERCGGGAVVMLMRVLVETAAMMDAEGVVAAATARQAVVTFMLYHRVTPQDFPTVWRGPKVTLFEW